MNLERMLLLKEGLLSCRGIFEQILKIAFMETKTEVRERFNATGMCKLIMDTTYTPPENATTFLLLREWRGGWGKKVNLAKLYGRLSTEIYEAPWSGESILEKMKYHPKEEQYVMIKVYHEILLSFDDTSSSVVWTRRSMVLHKSL